MKMLKIKLELILKIFFSFVIFIIFSQYAFSNQINIEIQGNNFTDDNVIFSLIDKPPTELSEEYSNYILKILDSSELFDEVSVTKDNRRQIAIIKYSNPLNFSKTIFTLLFLA